MLGLCYDVSVCEEHRCGISWVHKPAKKGWRVENVTSSVGALHGRERKDIVHWFNHSYLKSDNYFKTNLKLEFFRLLVQASDPERIPALSSVSEIVGKARRIVRIRLVTALGEMHPSLGHRSTNLELPRNSYRRLDFYAYDETHIIPRHGSGPSYGRRASTPPFLSAPPDALQCRGASICLPSSRSSHRLRALSFFPSATLSFAAYTAS